MRHLPVGVDVCVYLCSLYAEKQVYSKTDKKDFCQDPTTWSTSTLDEIGPPNVHVVPSNG